MPYPVNIGINTAQEGTVSSAPDNTSLPPFNLHNHKTMSRVFRGINASS